MELEVWRKGPHPHNTLDGKSEGNVACSIMAGRGWKQRVCASNFTLFLGRVSNQRCLRKPRLPVQEGMIPPGGNRWLKKKFQNRSIKCGILPYDHTIPLLGNIPHRVETDIEYMYTEVHSCIIHNSKKWKQPLNSIYI